MSHKCILIIINPSGDEARISRENYVNTVAVDVLGLDPVATKAVVSM